MKALNSLTVIAALLWFVILSCASEEKTPQLNPSHIQPVNSIDELEISTGQTIYVPAYSQIHYVHSGGGEKRTNLGVTLSIRNTDIDHPIIIKSAKYYDDDGSLLREYVEAPFRLSPMASTSYHIVSEDESGGLGANFIVQWVAEQPVHEPYIEAIMIGISGNQGFAWRSPGQVLK